MISIIDTPEEYRLRILAEECAELAQAALKMIRAKEHDTPIKEDDAIENLIEECADVMVGIRSVLNEMQLEGMTSICVLKQIRWEQRLNDAKVLQDGQG